MTAQRVPITDGYANSKLAPGLYRDNKNNPSGFALKVTDGGRKVFILKKKLRGTRLTVTVTLGEHGVLTASQARDAAVEAAALLNKGINPNEERKHEQEERDRTKAEELARAVTVRQVFDKYVQTVDLRESTIAQYRFNLKSIEDWLDKPIAEIADSREMVADRYVSVSKTKKRPGAANNAFGLLDALINYARDEHRTPAGEPIIKDNPVQYLRRQRIWKSLDPRSEMIPPDRLAEWYQTVQKFATQNIRDFFMVVLTTGLRREEALGLKWDAVNLSDQTRYVSIPGTKRREPVEAKSLIIVETKSGKLHKVPLSDFLYKLLRDRWQCRESEFVFAGRAKEGHLKYIDGACELIAEKTGIPFSAHSLRRTFNVIAGNLGIQDSRRKRLLNQSVKGDVNAAHYDQFAMEVQRKTRQEITDCLLNLVGINADGMPIDGEQAARTIVQLKEKRNGRKSG